MQMSNSSTITVQVYYKDMPWGDSFYVCGFISVFGGVMCLIFLIEHPHNVWLQNSDELPKGPYAKRQNCISCCASILELVM